MPAGRTAGAVAEAVEALEALVEQVVVPAGDEVRRRLHLGIALLHAVRGPELVEAAVAHDLPVEGALAEVVEGAHQRQAAVDLVPVDQVPGRVLVGAVPEPDEVHRVLQLQDAVAAHVPVVVLLVGDRHQALHVRAAQVGGQDLREAGVGDAEGADVAVAPGLRPEPLVCVVAVVGLVDVGPPLALRLVAAAAVLHDHGVAGGGEAHGPVDVALTLGAVGRADQEHREPLPVARAVEGGVQLDAVAHGNPQVELNVQVGRAHGLAGREQALISGDAVGHTACPDTGRFRKNGQARAAAVRKIGQTTDPGLPCPENRMKSGEPG